MRIARVAAIAALAFSTTLGTATAAAARAPHHGESPVEVNLTAGGIQAPDSHEGGLVTFRISTDDPGGRQLQMFQPHPGVPISQVLGDLGRAFSPDPATRAAGISAARDDAEALGGTIATPDVPATLTEEIQPGTVFLVDLTPAFTGGMPLVKPLELCGDNGRHLKHRAHSSVVQQETPAGPRFQTTDVDDADDAIMVHNNAGELHEMVIQSVAPGTTDDQVQQFFDGTGPSPFTGLRVGLGAISPNRTVLLHEHHLPPGRYVLLCEIPDDMSGIPHEVLGMHQVVDLH